MAILKEQLRGYKRYLVEVVKMWAKVHGLNFSLLWTASPIITILGVVGIIFSTNSILQYVSLSITSIFGFILIFSLLLIAPYKVWKRDTDNLNNRINVLTPLAEYKQEQLGNETDWLYLVVEMIDLGKRINRPEREIVVKFQIDSGLIYDFKPYRMWVSPILGGWEPSEPQLEIRQPSNLLKGQRSQLSSMIIVIKDDKLWESVSSARQGNDWTKALKVDIQLESGKSPIPFRSVPFYSDRANDAR